MNSSRMLGVSQSGSRSRPRHMGGLFQGDVADGRKVNIIELGDGRTAYDESRGKPNESGRRSGLRLRGREDVPKNIGGRIQVSDDAKRRK